MKSRGTVPSARSAVGALYHWMKVWPDAKLDRAVVANLYPYIVEKWRQGGRCFRLRRRRARATTAETSRRAQQRFKSSRPGG